jgi:hypothetical protein
MECPIPGSDNDGQVKKRSLHVVKAVKPACQRQPKRNSNAND